MDGSKDAGQDRGADPVDPQAEDFERTVAILRIQPQFGNLRHDSYRIDFREYFKCLNVM